MRLNLLGKVSAMGTLDKIMAWAKIYSKEESGLKMLYRIDQPDFPNIGLSAISEDQRFHSMYIYVPEDEDKAPTFISREMDDVMEELSENGSCVLACDDFTKARDFILTYLKCDAHRGQNLIGPDMFTDFSIN